MDIPQEAKVLITAGVLNRGKNIEVVLESLPKTDVKDLFLLIAGESFTREDLKYKSYLQELSRVLGLDEKKISFTGWLEKPKLWQLLRCSNLFLVASTNEGMPNVLLEALGCDLPCFGSNVAGIRDILRDDLLMFNPFDSETLARKVRSFFHDPTFCTKVAVTSATRPRKSNSAMKPFYQREPGSFALAPAEFQGVAMLAPAVLLGKLSLMTPECGVRFDRAPRNLKFVTKITLDAGGRTSRIGSNRTRDS